MVSEKFYANEEERKKGEIREQEEKQSLKKQQEFLKTKEKIAVEFEAEQDLNTLKNMLSKWEIDENLIKKVEKSEELDSHEIDEIFEKIEEIENIEEINSYIPEKLRITKSDYLEARKNDIFREEALTRIDLSLWILSERIEPKSLAWANIFSWFLSILDKNLVTIQEHHIDIKENLKNLRKETVKERNFTFWEKVIAFFKKYFW